MKSNARGIQLRLVRTAHRNSKSVTTNHSKYYLLHGTYAGTRGADRVFTGSHNWTISALRLNDEVILKLWDPAMISAFKANFDKIWRRHGGR